MKNPHIEQLRRRMKQFHQHHPWRLEKGVFTQHAYQPERGLSWWDDVGFILNDRRVMVWWTHPRMRYADEIGVMAAQEEGNSPQDAWPLHGTEKVWRKAGRSRKKVLAYRSPPTSESSKAYFDRLANIKTRLEDDGIDLDVSPSMSVKSYAWCSGVDLCIPVEVRNDEEMQLLANMAKRLLKGETTLETEFPGYCYGKCDWLAEALRRNQDRRDRSPFLG